MPSGQTAILRSSPNNSINMKLLHVLPSVDPRTGGPVEGVKQMGAMLRSWGHTVEVACLDAPDADWLSSFPLTVHALGPSKGNYRYTPKLVPWLRKQASHFDAVIVDGLWQYNGLGTWRALRDAKTPYFVFTHGMLDPWFKRQYPFKHLKKWLYWPWAEYRVLRDAAAVIFTCEEERILSHESFWLYKCTQEVSPFGTSLPPQDGETLRERFLTRFPQYRSRRIILFLGRMHEKKAPDLLVEAFLRLAPKHPEVDLVLVGPDEARLCPPLLQKAKEAGMGARVQWLGMLSGDDKWSAFHAADAFALPSHQENFGIAVAEAMGCGKPVLISNKVNIWREIQAGGGGLVGEDTLEGTTTVLKRWLELSAEARAAMGERAHATFLEHFTVEAMARGVMGIVDKHRH